MIRLFLSDLDGTLTNKDGSVKAVDLAAIRQLKEAGIDFGLVSGRDYGYCMNLIRRYGWKDCSIIGNNGGSIWLHGRKFMEEQMDAHDIFMIMNKLKDHLDELNPFICNEQNEFYLMKDHYASVEKWEEVRLSLSYLSINDLDLLDYLKETQDPIVKVSVHTYTQVSTDRWLPTLRKMFGEAYEVLPTSFDFIEITKSGIHKGNALCMLMDACDLNRTQVAVIGDGMNDIVMFANVDYSFAMASAREDVKRNARYVVKDVAEAIKFVI